MVGQSFQRTSLSNEAEKLAEMQGQHQASLSVSTEGDKTAIFVHKSLVEPSIPIFLPEELLLVCLDFASSAVIRIGLS